MPKGLQKESNDILIKYWEEGMTSTSLHLKKTIEKAARETSLSPTKVKVGVFEFVINLATLCRILYLAKNTGFECSLSILKKQRIVARRKS